MLESLPVFDYNGTRSVPTTISDVPFGRPVEVLFTLHYSYMDGQYYQYACIIRLQHCFE